MQEEFKNLVKLEGRASQKKNTIGPNQRTTI